MVNFLLTKARRLFDYADLGGSNNNGSIGGTTVTASRPNSESGGSLEAASINMEAAASNGAISDMSAVPRTRRKKCIMATTGIVGLFALILIILVYSGSSPKKLKGLPQAFSSATSSSTSNSEDSRRISYNHISSGLFHGRTWNGTWISDTEYLFHDFTRGLIVVDVRNTTHTQILSKSKFDHFNPAEYKLSADKDYLLIKRSHFHVYRRSSYGEYAILNLKDSKMLVPLKPTNLSQSHPDTRFFIRYVSWAPQGNCLVYVDFDNNLWYRKTVMSQDIKLTTNGVASQIYNGIPDWVYEEEVFEDNSALWWSPDATKLVYGSFDDSDVDIYFLAEYGSWKRIDQYPFWAEVRYPKANMTNPKNSLWMVNLVDQSEPKQVLPPTSLANEGETHFSWVTWADRGKKFAVTWMNRVQNKTVIALCSVNDLDCSSNNKHIFTREEHNGWIPYKYRITFNPRPPNPKTSDFVTILPAPFLKHHYRQLVYQVGDSRTFLTKVDGAEVVEVLKWTEDGYVYYISTLPYKPGTRHMFKIRVPTSANNPEAAQCLTCNLTMSDLGREKCTYYDVSMSKDGSFTSMNCLGPDIPYSCIHHTSSMQFLYTFETNRFLSNVVTKFDFPTVKFLDVPVSGSDQKARVKLLLPPDFNSGMQYPLIVYAYGGPGYQSVDSKFSMNDFGVFMAGSTNVIYAIVDPRGSGYQGEDWRFATYHHFGTPEVNSLTEITKHLQDNLGYINKERTAVWGWSYGGYLSLMTLAKDTEGVFACGASVAPVVDWTLYDTYYTERYMGLPRMNDNFVGYNKSSVFHYLDNLRTKKYYLLHGTHDDNVHYQQSMLLSAALEEKDILFRQQAYPDQDHSIFQYRTHLDHTLAHFFIKDCFDNVGNDDN